MECDYCGKPVPKEDATERIFIQRAIKIENAWYGDSVLDFHSECFRVVAGSDYVERLMAKSVIKEINR